MTVAVTVTVENSIAESSLYPLELFLSDWLSTVCAHEYNIDKMNASWNISFDSTEDALVVKLTDLPSNIGKYLDIQ